MKLQSHGSPEVARFRDSHAGIPGVPGQKGHLDATPAANHRVYYKGEVVGFPKGGGAGFPTKGSEVVAHSRARSVCVFKVSLSSPVACPNTKRIQHESQGGR